MKNIYPLNIIMGFFWHRKREEFASGRNIFSILAFLILFLSLFFIPSISSAQKLTFSYSYENITRNSVGGTLKNGDIIEVHALVMVNATTNSFYYIDTIPSGTSYMINSVKIVTNEGLTFRGPYTDKGGDDLGIYDKPKNQLRVNIGSGASNPNPGPAFGSVSGGGTVTPGDKPKF